MNRSGNAMKAVAGAALLVLAAFHAPADFAGEKNHEIPASGRVAGADPNAVLPNVADLPLVEVPAAAGSRDMFAVLISGAGGWAALDRGLSDYFASQGVSVVGLNSTKYLWTRRTPDEMARTLESVVRHYAASWNKPRVLLVGYSLGADILPFMASRLPEDLRGKTAAVVLVSPDATTDFEFHMSYWLGAGSRPGDAPVAPEIARLSGYKVFCVYGQDEKDTICPGVAEAVTRIELQGGHHFTGDYEGLAKRILDAVP